MEIVKLLWSQKSQFDLVEKIKNKSKNCTLASLFQSSEDGKREIYFMWPNAFVKVANYQGTFLCVKMNMWRVVLAYIG